MTIVRLKSQTSQITDLLREYDDFHYIIWWLIWYGERWVVDSENRNLYRYRLVTSDNRTNRQTARCRAIVLSQAKHAKRRIVVRHDVAQSLGL
jgi:hypothetical protein